MGSVLPLASLIEEWIASEEKTFPLTARIFEPGAFARQKAPVEMDSPMDPQ